MREGGVVFMFLAIVVCSVRAAPKNADKKHTVVAIVVKHNKGQNKNGDAIFKIDGRKISAASAPAPVPLNVQQAQPALVPLNVQPAQPAPVPLNVQPAQPVAAAPIPAKPLVPVKMPVAPPLPAKPLPVPQNTQPQPDIPSKVSAIAPAIPKVKQSDKTSDLEVDMNEILEDGKKEKKKEQDDITKKYPDMYPCENYSPVCNYYSIQAPDKKHIAQCRDVWMQKNCRKTCGICGVPWGVFLGCNDLDKCKKMGRHACIHEWVKQTCRAKCGICSPFERAGSSSVYVGKKKAEVPDKAEEQVDDSSGSAEEEEMNASEEDEEQAQEDLGVMDASGEDSVEDEASEEESDESSGSDPAEEEPKERSDEGKVKTEDKKNTKQRRMILNHGESQ